MIFGSKNNAFGANQWNVANAAPRGGWAPNGWNGWNGKPQANPWTPMTSAWPARPDEAISGRRVLGACFRKYFVFRGRATRGEFWGWCAWNALVYLVFVAVLVAFRHWGIAESNGPGSGASAVLSQTFAPNAAPKICRIVNLVFIFQAALWSLLTLAPTWSVVVRRLHDSNLSAGHIFWPLTGVGIFVLPILLARASTPGPNRFGLRPFKLGEQPFPPVAPPFKRGR